MQVLGCSKSATDPVIEATNTQEYIYTDYLTNPRPDLIILIANMHDNYPLNISSFVEHQLDLLDRFVSNKTQVVLVSLHNIVYAKLRRGLGPQYLKIQTLDENGKLVYRDVWARKMNNLIFRLASKRFISGGKPLLMPNMVEVSNTIADASKDGKHMREDWNQHIMSAVVQNVCDI